MAGLAVQFALVLCAVGGVQGFVAHAALEAVLVEDIATGQTLLGGVDTLAAARTLGGLDRLEGRHSLSVFRVRCSV